MNAEAKPVTYEVKPAQYWRINRRVSRRIFFDLPFHVRDVIAADADHETQDYKWFAKKVAEDTQRLFEDPTYYDNEQATFLNDTFVKEGRKPLFDTRGK